MDAQNRSFRTEIRPYGRAGIEEAARLIAQGLPVAIPTETVYGLAADATDGEAVARIYDAKGRPSFNPLIVHVASLQEAERVAYFEDRARRLAARFWPGPLTLVLPLHEDAPVAGLVTAGLPTIAVRVPAHSAMRDLLQACGKPLAAPSANASGRISPTRAAHVLASLDGRIPLILDAGPTEHGLESTILAITDDRIRLLRPGPLSGNDLGIPLHSADANSIEAPGQLASHYAPGKPLRLEADKARPGEWMIGFGLVEGDSSLSPTGNLIEAAASLFERLHEADRMAATAIAVAPIPDSGLGRAINDRLRRAAAPRS